MNKLKNRFPAWLLCLLLIAALLPSRAQAIDPIDLTQEVSLTIQYDYKDVPLVGAAFDLYRVADIDEFANAVPCSDFSAYGQITGLKTSSEWDVLAEDLVKYIDESKSISPMRSGTVGEKGACSFTGLQPGLYLVTGHKWVVKKGNDIFTYTCKPFLINLPNREESENTWDYDVLAEPKAGKPGHETDNPPPPPDLPQTGMLWWPVPVMLSVGLLFVLIGVLRRKRAQHEA